MPLRLASATHVVLIEGAAHCESSAGSSRKEKSDKFENHFDFTESIEIPFKYQFRIWNDNQRI